MARTSLYPPSVDPGFPELLPPPEGWRRTTFGELVEVIERPLKLNPAERYRLLTARRNRGGITLRGEMDGREILTKTQFEVHGGDFLISRRQIIHGACGVVPGPLHGAVVSNEYSTLRTRPGLAMEFLQHFSHSPYFQRTCFHSSHGVDVEKMIFKIDEWLAREVNIAPLPEQKKIAAILSSVDAAIEATEAVIEQLQVVKKAMMAELFTRGILGRHTKFKMTEIGEVPEEWAVAPIGSLSAVTSGGTPSRDRPDFWGGGIPWVKTGEINYDDIFETEESISETGVANSSAKVVPAGSLLMAMYGQGATRGRVAVLGIDAALNQACLAILPGDKLSTRFLFHVLTDRYEQLRSLGHEGTQKNLNAALVKQVVVPVPPRDEQADIVSVLDSLNRRSGIEQAIASASRDAMAALMSVLLTGEVRVKPDEVAA